MADISRSPQHAPDYALHRDVAAADGAGAITDGAQGINMSGYEYAHIQVLSAGGGNASVQVQWWSAEAGAFVQEHTPIAKAGVGVNVPYEFTVECRGRVMFVKVTTLAAGTCKVLVSGFGLFTTT